MGKLHLFDIVQIQLKQIPNQAILKKKNTENTQIYVLSFCGQVVHHNSPGIKGTQQIAPRSKPSDGDDVDGNGRNDNAWTDVVVVLHEGHGPQQILNKEIMKNISKYI